MPASTDSLVVPLRGHVRPAADTAARDPLVGAIEARIRDALHVARETLGADDDPYRGLYLDGDRLSEASPMGAPLYPPASLHDVAALGNASPRLVELGRRLGLDAVDRAILALSLAPAVDDRLARVYAYLQDDVARTRVSVGLLLDLIAPDAGARADLRARFVLDAPLLRSGVLRLSHERAGEDAPLIARDAAVAASVEHALLGRAGAPPRLRSLLRPPSSRAAPRMRPADRRALRDAWRRDPAARVQLEVDRPDGWGDDARRMAAATGRPCLTLDTSAFLALDRPRARRLLLDVLLQARVSDALLHVPLPPPGTGSAKVGRADLLDHLGRHDGPLLLTGPIEADVMDAVPGLLNVRPTSLDFEGRRRGWRHALRHHDIELESHVVEALADRFGHAGAEVEDTVRNAVHAAGGAASVDAEALFSAARGRSDRTLGNDARRLDPMFTWHDLVLASDARAQLREISQRVRHRRQVLDDWGVARGGAEDRGVAALFSGPSGTGKTMAARVLAADLELDLYRVDLSRVVSKYIGETEKNLGRVFDAAESSNAILFFDEADALFGKRSEVSDAHDRYANIEVGYLLQRMETFGGITVLATNLRNNMDEAFVRRLDFHVQFALPDEAERREIWTRVLPDSCPLDDTVDLPFLAERFPLSGGNIRNAALAGAFLAAEEGGAVGMRHLVRGVRREFQKMGKACVDSDFGPWYAALDAAYDASPGTSGGGR